MHRSQFSERELRLEAERNVKYRGTVRVRLETLHFQWNEPRELSRKNVERLKEIFGGDKRSCENIRRLDPRNHIPAVIEQSDLDNAILTSKLSTEGLLSNPDNPPVLKFAAGYRLACLHGRHRIQAARETLPPTDAWWTVDLYLADANPELRATLVEEYSNEKTPSDGEIYRKIRRYEREGNICFKKRWKAFLSDHRQRGLRQLKDHGDGEFLAAFDKLLDIPGLWGGMRISTLPKVFEPNCDEEALHYLEHIRKTIHRIFNRVLRTDETALQRVDQVTIEELELKAPGCSENDAQALHGKLLTGQICSLFSQEERELIWSELRSVNYLIPSLSTFFEDLKYLHACADCLKLLVKVPSGCTIRRALKQKFPYREEASDQYVLEVAESTFVPRSHQAVDHFEIGYRQLWLFAMRHYTEMPSEFKKSTKVLLAKAGVQKADEEVLSRAVDLADRVGFVSDELEALKERSPDREIARNALLKARKPDLYQYDETALEAFVSQIARLFTTATRLPSEYSSPALVSHNPKAAGKRCGYPDEDAQQQDRKHLFLPHLHAGSEEQGKSITSFFVRRSVYLAFFGHSADLGLDSGFDFSSSPPSRTPPTGTAMSGSEMDETERSRQQRLEREDADRAQAERRKDRERRDQERREQERRDQERRDQEQQDREQRDQEQRDQEQRDQARRELRTIEETLEREDLQERLGQAFKAQQQLEQEEQRQQQLQDRERERLDEERQRRETRERGRREQEAAIQGNSERRKRHTEIVMDSAVGDQRGLAVAALQSGDLGAETTAPRPRRRRESTPVTQTPDSVWITFKILERGVWRTAQSLHVRFSDPSEVERIAVKYMRKKEHIRVYDTDLNILTPQMCYEAAMANRCNILLLIPGKQLDISEELEASVSQLLSESESSMEAGIE